MTKKSYARQQRDQFKAQNTGWDDLTAIYREHQSCLNHIIATTKNFFEIEGIHQFIPAGQAGYASGLVSGLAKDVRSFQLRLNELYKRHAHMTGMFHLDTEKPHEYVQFTALGADYVQYGMDYNTILDPLYRQALGLMQTIEQNVERHTSEGIARAEKEAADKLAAQQTAEPAAV